MDIKQRTETACTILRATNDGDDLVSWQLSFLQDAVNCHLTDEGYELFELLSQVVREGIYRRYQSPTQLIERLHDPDAPPPAPGLHGVEHLDCDSQGYIYWKGIQVEHYNRPTHPEMAPNAKKLGARCMHLESLGVPVNGSTTCWFFSWFEGMPSTETYKEIMSHCPNLYDHKDGTQAAIVLRDVAFHYDGEHWTSHQRILSDDPFHYDEWDWRNHYPESNDGVQCLEDGGFLWADCGQPEHCGVCYADYAGVVAWLIKYRTPTDLVCRQ